MFYSQQLTKFIIVLLCGMWLLGCATHQQKPITISSDTFFDFETAVRLLTNNLLLQVESQQIKQHELKHGIFFNKRHILINPFIYATTNQPIILNSGIRNQVKEEVQTTSKNIYELIKEAKKYPTATCKRKLCRHNEVTPFPATNNTFDKFTNFSIQNMEASISHVDYIMYGVVTPKRFITIDNTEIKYFLLDIAIKNTKNDLTVARKHIKINADIHISSYKGNFHSLPKELAYQITIDQETESPNLDIRQTKARTFSEQGKFKTAEMLYKELIAQGAKMELYQELYQIYLKNKRKEQADNTLFEMLQFLVANDDKRLGMLYLFMPNSVVPIELNEDIITYVQSWFIQFEKLLAANDNYCLNVIGHSSHSGSAKSNITISLQRANEIAKRIIRHYPKITKLKTWGRGYHKCCNCSGMDNNFDLIDRRVELKVTRNNCPENVPEYKTVCFGLE